MDELISLAFYFLFGTILVVGIGILIQLKQQKKMKNEKPETDNVH